MIYILFTLLIVFLIIFSYLIYLAREQINHKKIYSIFIREKTKGKTSIYQIYSYISEIKIFRKYINKLYQQFAIIMPGDHHSIVRHTMITSIFIWIVDGLLILLLFVLQPSLYSIIITLTYIYILNTLFIFYIVENSELKLLKQFDKWVGDIRHNYQIHEMIDESIYDTIENTKYPMKLHAARIFHIIESNDIETETDRYNEDIPNRFLKTFLAMSSLIMNLGDKRIENQSLFLTNLKYLRQEVEIEIMNREKIKHLFSGLILINIVPLLFVRAIQKWAITSFIELKNFYYGTYGIFVLVLIFLSTIISFNIISNLKSHSDIEIKDYFYYKLILRVPIIRKVLDQKIHKNYGRNLICEELLKQNGENMNTKEFIIKRFVFSLISFIASILIFYFIHGSKKNLHVNYINFTDYPTTNISEKQLREGKDMVNNLVKKYKKKQIDDQQIWNIVSSNNKIRNKEFIKIISKEVIIRIHLYQREYFKWYELMFSFIISIFSYQIPYYILIFKRKLRQMKMEDEVIQFHSIILMLMYIDRMTIETVLEWMESFAYVFKSSIQKAVNNIGLGELETLEELKSDEPFEPFVRIIENLEICDKLPMHKAFDEIAVDRQNYQEKRKLENEKHTEKKVIIAKIFAWTPFFITIGLYLILPFVIEGLSQLMGSLRAIGE